MKVLVTRYTNVKILDDEHVQTMPKESRRVVTPTVKEGPIARNLVGGKDDPSISQTSFPPWMVTDKNSP